MSINEMIFELYFTNKNLLFFKNFPVDMAGIGPFIPHPHTPLNNEKSDGHFDLSLKMFHL